MQANVRVVRFLKEPKVCLADPFSQLSSGCFGVVLFTYCTTFLRLRGKGDVIRQRQEENGGGTMGPEHEAQQQLPE